MSFCKTIYSYYRPTIFRRRTAWICDFHQETGGYSYELYVSFDIAKTIEEAKEEFNRMLVRRLRGYRKHVPE